MSKTYQVTVDRANEGAFQSPEVTFEATDISIHEDGTLSFKSKNGARSFSPISWSGFQVVRLSRDSTNA